MSSPSGSRDPSKVNDMDKKLLSLVENSKFFKEHPPRDLPLFDSNEIKVGKILGVGGFCDVHEVCGMSIIPQTNGHNVRSTLNETTDLEQQTVENDLEFEEEEFEDFDVHDDFVEMNDVKKYMAKNCIRQTDARYALKRLRRDIEQKQLDYALLDLAVEAKFLASIIHPNIVKMRGTSSKSLQKDSFLVLDRLYDTLETRIDIWSGKLHDSKGCCGMGGNQLELKKLMLQRITVSYDLASAFLFLHQKGLIYRDIKTENIGFDVRGDVKVFDFGLCKELKSSERCKKTKLYRMTGKTGSVRYMAPEVAKCEPYDQRADVYSFGILLWEILSCRVAFEQFCTSDYKQVIFQGYRPPIEPSNFTVHTKSLVKECWSSDVMKRPVFSRIASLLRGEMTDLSEASEITDRTTHMLSRSKASGHNRVISLSKDDDGTLSNLSPPREKFRPRHTIDSDIKE